MLSRTAVVLSITAIAMLAAVGCGDGGGGGDVLDVQQTLEAGKTALPQDGAAAELSRLAARAAEGVTARITYDVTGGSSGEAFQGEWVVTRRSPDFRFDILATDSDDTSTNTTIINTEGKSYLCVAGGGDENCVSTSSEQTDSQVAPLEPIFNIPGELIEQADAVQLVESFQREIAGRTATCFKVKSPIQDLLDGEICFSEDGLILLLNTQVGGGSFILNAAKVSTDVTDADFEPPYAVTELPN